MLIYGQNLLPDGSFELISNASCIDPKNGFVKPVHWYSTLGTPDLFTNNCKFPAMNEVFWTESNKASHGSNFMGLRCRVNANQTYISEGIATKLSENLEAGEAYFIKLKLRNKGFYQGFPTEVISCPLKPAKNIEIYTHSDSIIITNDFSNGTVSSNAMLSGKISSEIMNSDEVSEEWRLIGTCFIPEINSNFISLTMPLGNFGTFPECSSEDTQGTFFSYYFDLDDLILEPIPESLDTTLYKKENAPIEVFLPDIFNLNFLDGIEYQWEDGFIGSKIEISTAGVYTIRAILECEEILLHLTVVDKNNLVPLYIPNAFSPNNDGINDLFLIASSPETEVLKFDLKIFDRWGNLIFNSDNIVDSWNGTYKDRLVPEGVYVYIIDTKIEDKSGINEYTSKGIITVIN